MHADTAIADARTNATTKRWRRYAVLAAVFFLVLFACAALSLVRGRRELQERLMRLEAEHRLVLALIEDRSKELPRDDDP